MEKTVEIGGKEVKLKASALVPRLYRFKFGRDMIRDMSELQKKFLSVVKSQETRKRYAGMTQEELEALPPEEQAEIAEVSFSVLDLTLFENVAYIMAKHADNTVPDSPDEWLEGFEMFSIYHILPQILELWGMSNKTTSEPKKK